MGWSVQTVRQTTLLPILMGAQSADSGAVHRSKLLRVGCLEQTRSFRRGRLVRSCTQCICALLAAEMSSTRSACNSSPKTRRLIRSSAGSIRRRNGTSVKAGLLSGAARARRCWGLGFPTAI